MAGSDERDDVGKFWMERSEIQTQIDILGSIELADDGNTCAVANKLAGGCKLPDFDVG